MNAAIAGALLLFGLLFTAAAGAGFGLGRRVEQRAGARQLQSAQTLYTALRATAVRSDLEGTLGTLLTHACEGLLAVAGSVHLSKGASDSTLRLVGSIGVSEQAALTTVSAADPLWLALPAVPDGVLVLGLDDQRPPWGVFQAAGAHALVAVAVGAPGPERHGLLVLAFPSLDLAHEVRATVGSLGRHAGALLREFKAIDRRAADFKELARAAPEGDSGRECGA